VRRLARRPGKVDRSDDYENRRRADRSLAKRVACVVGRLMLLVAWHKGHMMK
jgi:hypothetical protein